MKIKKQYLDKKMNLQGSIRTIKFIDERTYNDLFIKNSWLFCDCNNCKDSNCDCDCHNIKEQSSNQKEDIGKNKEIKKK